MLFKNANSFGADIYKGVVLFFTSTYSKVCERCLWGKQKLKTSYVNVITINFPLWLLDTGSLRQFNSTSAAYLKMLTLVELGWVCAKKTTTKKG